MTPISFSPDLCAIPDCGRPVADRNLCVMHFKRFNKLERFAHALVEELLNTPDPDFDRLFLSEPLVPTEAPI